MAPIEAHVRLHSGRYLDPWYNRLRDAYVQTMADLGVTTARGGIGKLRQRNRSQVAYYEPWSALKRETWRPDIRAAALANVRVSMHRKLTKTAAAADLYPVAIGTDAIAYPSSGPSLLDVLPYTDEGKPAPGTFRLGISPGMVKHQGTQTVLWAEQQFEEAGGVFNLTNLIKNDPTAGEGGGE
ncbi:hypothetical protein [Streptomyces phaeochromogenes]|uniref:hypothetical protein n=1 Tax=Streptomyces phaeochromogenes TaxID=1923 RepID=UPI003F4D2121